MEARGNSTRVVFLQLVAISDFDRSLQEGRGRGGRRRSRDCARSDVLGTMLHCLLSIRQAHGQLALKCQWCNSRAIE
jgi:hypothetical protein